MNHFVNSLLAMLCEMSPYILLGFLIAGILHAFVKPRTMSRHLAGNGMGAVAKAALLGIPLPLCSCGVLPTAVSLRRNGASDAATTSFLIATPQTGVDSIAATYALLGPAFAVMRPVGALAGALLGGCMAGRISPTKSAERRSESQGEANAAPSFWERCARALKYGFVEMVGSVGKWLVTGLVVAAAITVFVPDELFLSLARYPIAAMLLMVAVAVPMYVCATGSIPIALSLILKGLTPGVAFVLLMAGPAANFASVMVLRRAMGGRATAVYIASVIVTALCFGVLIDYLLPPQWFVPSASSAVSGGCHTFGLFDTACSVLLAALLVYSLLTRHGHSHSRNAEEAKKRRVYKIEGMMCPHCQATVQRGLAQLRGVESVQVELKEGCAIVTGEASPQEVADKIEALGYDCTGLPE